MRLSDCIAYSVKSDSDAGFGVGLEMTNVALYASVTVVLIASASLLPTCRSTR